LIEEETFENIFVSVLGLMIVWLLTQHLLLVCVCVWGDVITVQGGKRLSSDSSLNTLLLHSKYYFWTHYFIYISLKNLNDDSNFMLFMLC